MIDWLLKYINPTYLTFLGGLLVLIGAALASHSQSREARRAESYLEELNTKNKELVKLQEELKHTVTGGDSFAYLDYRNNSERRSFVLRHFGKYPVYDVGFYIKNLRKQLAEPNNVMAYQNPDFAVVTPDTQAAIPDLYPTDDEPIVEYSIEIETRAGVFFELLQVAKTESGSTSAYKVFRKKDNSLTLLKEQVDAGFPRTSDGSIRWPNISVDADGSMKIGLRNYSFEEKDNKHIKGTR